MIGGSLFSGIEGFGLGLLWSGLITSIAFQVEMDPFCQRVLAARFSDVNRSVKDVRLASASTLPRVDLLFGGPPCQDVSGAGKGVGLTGARSGLVVEMLRLADELRPRVVLVENVASGARRWVCPVRGSLEALGYRTAALNIGVDDCGGPHRRKRIFILAYTERDALRLDEQRETTRRAPRELRHGGDAEPCGGGEAMAYTPSGVRFGEASRQARHVTQRNEGVADTNSFGGDRGRGGGEERRGVTELENSNKRNAQPGLGGLSHGIPARVARWPAGPSEEQHAWEPPRVAESKKDRAAKLKAIGNAVSPIQAYHVGLWAKRFLVR